MSPLEPFEAGSRSKQLIKSAILENDFLKNLDASQVKEIVDAMIPKDVPSGVHIIREGDAGSHLYVCAEGELEVTKNGTVLGKMGPGRAFGELAILYNCRRTASIKAIQPSKVWALERRVFQQVMMKTGLRRTEDTSKFLRSVPLLQNLSEAHIRKITDVLEVTFFPGGTYITRQGTQGDSFYIISSGKVKVTQTRDGEGETEIRTLARGDYFGEQALLKEEVRTANVIAIEPGVECLEVDREAFVQFIGDLREIQEKEYNVPPTSPMRPPATSADSKQFEEFPDMVLDDLDLVGTLGIGGFGRVELVQYSKQKGTTFALKCLKKKHIVDTQQQEHVMGEKRIMLTCRHLFIARLYRTFKDDKYLYMLMEACLGGELWTILRDRSRFDEQSTRFYTACVVEALGYLHSKGIIYRDLKPENLLLDAKGYIKMVDFGFSKYVGPFEKTWTFCGTPEYVAPEVILNKGHDKAVDYWSLGVFMYELLSGAPPFTSSDPMKTYNIILRGIDSINFPRYMSRNSIALIRKLCRDSPAERLGLGRQGVGEIRKHKFFTGFDWDGLNSRSLPPPIFPSVKSPVDISNFDAYPKETSLPPDDLSGWDKDF
ncbi:unnamed protein product [Cyprideis torosa]|uniref:cGMP-dependent protein kinase n=1 Tax=Cyprideis torosa TaxID=163714 RepID=A0A7R8WGE1_9CRUS|nr:unnamed protein product [Cyprideis torosa]CAG0892869.1 unnamed protein product [Cyprideis torosa]